MTEAARRARNADRFPSGRFKVTTYVCYCGSKSEGARSRDLHDASHVLDRKPAWYYRELRVGKCRS